ncbi:N-acetylglutamate synthase [Desulfacinum hydrothermale DSM 13146]|uniref:N-acetylglutamate synthase n=1 Tax=Desulfacinum hydrothermale DSM 13146 TaxID=1121390 RepID=A0A1W1XIY2_9BACT|nr:N-acetyltransferase [Desulfacinum hydrothermale]SMC23940.1 N-acetylglutamate synthase [Desulfacinum hydrothermale DSM 13146]
MDKKAKGVQMIRKARISDVKCLHRLLNAFASEGRLLPRSLNDLYTHIRDTFVWEDTQSKEILGCASLHVVWEDLAEIRSLAVKRECQGHGIGAALVRACVEEARELEIARVFVLTYEVAFFQKQGFHLVEKHIFPQKIWVDCLHCSKFPDCDETALLMDLA